MMGIGRLVAVLALALALVSSVSAQTEPTRQDRAGDERSIDSASSPAPGTPESDAEEPGGLLAAPAALAWAAAHPVVAGVVLWVVGFPLLWGMLLVVRPRALLTPLRLCASIGEFSFLGFKFLAVEHVLFLSPFASRERVLDDWVEHHLAHARQWFADRDTVRDRARRVDLPVRLEGRMIARPAAGDLRALFERPQVQLLIHGDGGSGKTSLACQIGHWAMASAPGSRLRARPMLPVLFESDFVQQSSATLDDVLSLVQLQIHAMTGSRHDLPQPFLRELCASGRVLVIIDSLSERSAAVRDFLALRGGAMVPFRYLVLTSRTEERQLLAQAAPVRMQPVLLQGDALWEFVHAYEASRSGGGRLSDRDLIQLCERLSEMAGDRDITAMLATMYVSMEIRRVEARATADEPQSIPHLMHAYVRETSERSGLHRGSGLDQLHTALKRVSWELVRESLRPRPCPRPRLAAALAADLALGDGVDARRAALEQANTYLDILETRLKLLQAVGSEGDVKVSLDPLAEYMAAAQLIVDYGGDDARWRDFLASADELSLKSGTDDIRGFLVAVRDTCASSEALPLWLEASLAERLGLEMTARARTKRLRQQRFFLRRLQSSDPSDQLDAIGKLEALGAADLPVEHALAAAVDAGTSAVRSAAIHALGELNRRGPRARAALVRALQDQDPGVRHAAVVHVGIAQNDPDRGVSLLLPLVEDPEPAVRDMAAWQLGRLEDPGAAPALTQLLSDPEHDVRVAAAVALTRVAPGASSVEALLRTVRNAEDLTKLARRPVHDLPGLLREHPAAAALVAEWLEHRDSPLRAAAAEVVVTAFREGPPPVVSARLLALLNDSDPDVTLWAAAASLNWNLERDLACAALTGLTSHSDAGVRRAATVLLAKLAGEEQRNDLLRAALSDPAEIVRLSAAVGLIRGTTRLDEGVAALEQLATSEDPRVRFDVAVTLGKRLKAAAGPRIENLLGQLLRDAHPEVREEAAAALIDRGGEQALRALTRVLSDSSPRVRARAAEAVARLGPGSETDPRALRPLLHDRHFEVQIAAARAVWRLTGSAALVLPVLAQYQTANRSSVEHPFDLLAEMAAAGQSDSHLIALGLEDGSQFTRRGALEALKASASVDDELVPLVIELLDDDWELIREGAIDWLARAGVSDPRVRRRIVALSAGASEGVRSAAILAIGELADRSPDALEAVLRATESPSERVAAAAVDALEWLAPADDVTVPAMLRLFQHEAWWPRFKAQEWLERRIATDSGALAERLLDTIPLMPPARHHEVLEIVARADLPAVLVPRVLPLLDHADPGVRRRAALMLGQPGLADDSVRRRLRDLLTDPDDGMRAAALAALARVDLDEPDLVAAAQQSLSAGELVDRLPGAAVLAARGDEERVTLLRDVLRRQGTAEQAAALTALRVVPAAIDPLLRDVESLLHSESMEVSRSAASLLLRTLSADAAVDVLAERLTHGTNVTATLLGAGPRIARAVPALLAAAERGMPSALLALADVSPPALTPELLQWAATHATPEMRAAAARAVPCAALGPDAAREQLMCLARDRAREVRVAARRAMFQLRDSAANIEPT